MKYLFGGCYRSDFAVFPKNWKSQKASLKKPWHVFYRFYDPANKELHPGGKDVRLRAMNKFKDLADRQTAMQEAIDIELDLIDGQGYNPITDVYMAPEPVEEKSTVPYEVTPDTPLIDSLTKAFELVDGVKQTRDDIRSVLKYFAQSAEMLQKDRIPLKDIRRADLIYILKNCKNLTVELRRKSGIVKVQKIWNANQFNTYRKYLSILYSQLVIMEVVDYNPVDKIPVEQDESDQEKTPRATLTKKQGAMVNEILFEEAPNFHRWVHIFFHSGARVKELMRVQGKNVDVAGQRFRVLVKKRKKKVWVSKTIKDIALPFWIEAMKGCQLEDFVFGLDFLPASGPVHAQMPTRWWKRLIKEKGIDVDLYALKHQNTTTMVDMMIEETSRREAAQRAAAAHNSHTSEAMVVEIYDTKGEERKHEQIKKVNNTFG